MMIYHSHEAIPALYAAAIHMGWIPEGPPVDRFTLKELYRRLGGPEIMTAEGLWPFGKDPDGHRVFAAGRMSRPSVVHRAFHGFADLLGIERSTFLLQSVGGAVAWIDMASSAMKSVGLPILVETLQIWNLASQWPGATRSVRIAKERLSLLDQVRR